MKPILTDEIRDERLAAIDMDASLFREAGHRLIDDIADFLSSIRSYHVTPAHGPRSLQAKLPASMPVTGVDVQPLLKETWDLLCENSLLNGHPRFWGYITSSPAPIGMLADLLASAINSNSVKVPVQ